MHALRGVEVVELGSRVRSLTRKPLIVQSRSRYLHHLARSVIAYHFLPNGFMSAVPRCVTLPYTVLSVCVRKQKEVQEATSVQPQPPTACPVAAIAKTTHHITVSIAPKSTTTP